MDDINIRITELEAILTNHANEYEDREIAEFEQELYELRRKQKDLFPKEFTLDFTPDKTQILRNICCISAHCKCPHDYKVSYELRYDCNEISIMLMKNGMTVFSRTLQPEPGPAFKPLSIHEAERIVTDKVIDYVLSTCADDMTDCILSRLRSWDPDESVRPLDKNKRYVFLDRPNNKILRVDGYHDGCGNGYHCNQKVKISDTIYNIESVSVMVHKDMPCEIIRVIQV